MQKLLSIHAYDSFENVQVTARIREYSDRDDMRGTLALALETQLASAGEDDPREWLKDVLVWLLETL